ncbi:sigma-70 family RNA polymerase sigma factor [Lachnospiraceae bacterium M18-1]|nr:sigma-70 family RNA polymerase sigma factor [Lachnospiraceae bacterium M18-1]
MLTLQELKQILEMPECNAKLPTAKQLRESGLVIVKEKIGVDSEILAYRNGYAVYCVGNHSTVFPIHLCGDYLYLEECNAIRLPEQFFCEKEWYLRLVLEGEDRLNRNHEAKEQSRSIPYHAISEDWAEMENPAKSVLECFLVRETVSEILQFLTERQKYIMERYYLQEETQEQISKELGISQQTVSAVISHAIRNIRKKYQASQKPSGNRECYTEGLV